MPQNNAMRHSILLLCVGIILRVDAVSLFVSVDGNNTNNGTINAPFRTLQYAVDQLQIGDICYIRGGTYRETVIIQNKWGNENNITRIQAYSNETVIITGLDEINTWSHVENSIFRTPTEEVLQVFESRNMMTEARWPNTSSHLLQPHFAYIDSMPTVGPNQSSTLYDSELSQFPAEHWNNAKIWYLPGDQWTSTSSTITDHNTNQLTFINNSNNSFLQPQAGNPYFIFDTYNAIDSPSEWYYDNEDGHLYFHAPHHGNPNELDVEIRTRYHGILIQNSQYVEVSGLHFFAANIKNLYSAYCFIKNCKLEYAVPLFGGTHLPDVRIWKGMEDAAIEWQGSNGAIQHCEIAHSWSAGITIPYGSYQNNLIENCLIYDVNWIGTWAAGIHPIGHGHTISSNTIYDVGRNGIDLKDAKNAICEYNHVARAGWITKDQGSLKTGVTDGENTIIRYNWFRLGRALNNQLDAWCTGVYLDNDSINYLVHHNVVWDHDNALRMNMASAQIEVYNNTFVNSSHEDIAQYAPSGQVLRDITIYNNIGSLGSFDASDVDYNYNTDGSLQQLNFIGPEYGDFRISPSSIAIDQGTPIAGITDHITDLAPDAGAYEFNGNDWIPGINWIPSWNQQPLANFTNRIVHSHATNSITFDATASTDADGMIIRYEWDLGDGTTAHGKTYTHSYTNYGTYIVTLHIRDDLNSTNAITKTIILQDPATIPQPERQLLTSATDVYLYANNVVYNNSELIAGKLVSGTNPQDSTRSFIRFDLDTLKSLPIQSAYLNLYHIEGYSDTWGGVYLYPIAAAWTPESITFDHPINDSLGLLIQNNGPFETYVHFDITTLMKQWQENPQHNFGISLRGFESYGINAKYFQSSEALNPPYIDVTYRQLIHTSIHQNPSNATTALVWDSNIGSDYRIESTTNLIAGNWVVFQEDLIATPPTNHLFITPVSDHMPTRFFRISTP
jgi:hypothetical protein